MKGLDNHSTAIMMNPEAPNFIPSNSQASVEGPVDLSNLSPAARREYQTIESELERMKGADEKETEAMEPDIIIDEEFREVLRKECAEMAARTRVLIAMIEAERNRQLNVKVKVKHEAPKAELTESEQVEMAMAYGVRTTKGLSETF